MVKLNYKMRINIADFRTVKTFILIWKPILDSYEAEKWLTNWIKRTRLGWHRGQVSRRPSVPDRSGGVSVKSLHSGVFPTNLGRWDRTKISGKLKHYIPNYIGTSEKCRTFVVKSVSITTVRCKSDIICTWQ